MPVIDKQESAPSRVALVILGPTPRGETVQCRLEVMKTKPQLFEVVRTLAAAGRLARRLDSRQQQSDEDADDGNHDEQLDQSKSGDKSPVDSIIHLLLNPGGKCHVVMT